MSESMTEVLPMVRCTEATKRQLEAIVERGPGSQADHVRHAVERYIEADANNLPLHLKRVASEFKQAIGQAPPSEAATVMVLVNHWDRTKQDAYGLKSGIFNG